MIIQSDTYLTIGGLYTLLLGIRFDLTRQLSFLTNNYTYKNGEDPENSCILLPRYRAAGRVAPDGKRYSEREVKVNEEDYVPVRSLITKFRDPDIVTPDCLSTKYKDLTEGAGIGVSFGTSLTEAITQGALGLKNPPYLRPKYFKLLEI